MKNTNYLNWDEYFMGIALLSAKRSKDPNTCVGACIVSQENRILSVGYNDMPRGCSDDEYPWAPVSKMLLIMFDGAPFDAGTRPPRTS